VVERVLGLTAQHEFTLLAQLEVDLVKIVYANSDTNIVACAVRALVLCVGEFQLCVGQPSYADRRPKRDVTAHSVGGRALCQVRLALTRAHFRVDQIVSIGFLSFSPWSPLCAKQRLSCTRTWYR
jgi:hypothetical protein